MSPRFLADADLNHKIVAGLRRREPAIDILDAHEGGVIGVPDAVALRLAAESGRVLLSHDRNTMPAHLARFAAHTASAGVIIVSQSLDIGAAIEDLLLIWAASDASEWRDRVGFRSLVERGPTPGSC